MNWTRSETLALANQRCTHCRGIGLRVSLKQSGHTSPCNCVLRAIFRSCFERFAECATQDRRISHVRIERRPGKGGHATWGRKDEEYLADFMSITERTLTPVEFKLFRIHFILGADSRLCCEKFKIDRGSFFHAVYRIEQKLGRAFREVEPYSLYPLDEYFGGTVKTLDPVRRGSYPDWPSGERLSERVPVKKAA